MYRAAGNENEILSYDKSMSHFSCTKSHFQYKSKENLLDIMVVSEFFICIWAQGLDYNCCERFYSKSALDPWKLGLIVKAYNWFKHYENFSKNCSLQDGVAQTLKSLSYSKNWSRHICFTKNWGCFIFVAGINDMTSKSYCNLASHYWVDRNRN